MAEQRFRVAVVMERVAIESRWADVAWRAAAVELDADDAGGAAGADGPSQEPTVSAAVDATRVRWRWPAFEVELHRSEAEGYYLNVTSPRPFAFVMWRLEDERAVPSAVTLSYNEAGRWLDGGAQVEGVPLPVPLLGALASWVAANYRPEPRRKVRRNDPFRDGAFRRDKP